MISRGKSFRQPLKKTWCLRNTALIIRITSSPLST